MDTIDAAFRPETVAVLPEREATAQPAPPWARGKSKFSAALPGREGVKAFARRWRRPLTALGIILAGAVALTVLVATAPEVAREPKPERAWTVDTVPAARGDTRPEIRLMGTLQPGREVQLRALVAGTVQEVSPAMRNGGVVRSGEVLMRVEPLDFELAVTESRASLEEARARLEELRATAAAERTKVQFARQQLDVRERDVARSQQLFERGTIAAPRLEQAQVALSQERQSFAAAQNALQAGEARVKQQEATVQRLEAGLTKAETDLARTSLVAPFDGFVGRVRAEAGMRVSPTEQVGELSGAEGLEATVTLPTDAYGRLVRDGEGIIGREAQVAWALGDTTLTYPARVERVVDRIDTATGGVAVYVRLEGNFIDKPLRPGAFVTVSIPDRLYTNVVELPATALHGDGTVYVVGKDDRLEARKVAVVSRKADSVFVGEGLEPGAQVVTTRFQEIASGVKVTVRKPAEAQAGQNADQQAAQPDARTEAPKAEGGQ